MRRALYRIKQGVLGLLAFVRPIHYAELEPLLTPDLLALFKRMRRSEQWHSIRVMHALAAQGHTQPDLLVAALLHDEGKARYPYTLLDRTVVVLARRFAPERARAWGQGEPRGLARPFVIAAQHPAWSAEDMAQAGASPLAVALARQHQIAVQGEPSCEADRLLKWLQAVDNVS
jgi:hypothetical protein